jgi:hypothetical protein
MKIETRITCQLSDAVYTFWVDAKDQETACQVGHASGFISKAPFFQEDANLFSTWEASKFAKLVQKKIDSEIKTVVYLNSISTTLPDAEIDYQMVFDLLDFLQVFDSVLVFYAPNTKQKDYWKYFGFREAARTLVNEKILLAFYACWMPPNRSWTYRKKAARTKKWLAEHGL